MDKLNEIAQKAVARAIEAGLIEATDQDARKAVAGMAVRMASLADPSLLIAAL
jgi:hypothetical protein